LIVRHNNNEGATFLKSFAVRHGIPFSKKATALHVWVFLGSLLVLSISLAGFPSLCWADTDEAINTAAGLQPLHDPLPKTKHFLMESRLFLRDDGSYQAVPEVHGRTKIFRLVEYEAPWTLRPGLTVMAKTYNGVVPGPTIVINQGDHIVIELRNALAVADTLHLHGIHGGNVDMDGVSGVSQPMIQPGSNYSYVFDANQSGTFMYHSHGSESMVDSGLYGGIIVNPSKPRPEELASHDYLQMISSWAIQSLGENHFTINGKSYPATKALEITKGQRIRIRWVNISGENDHTMHTHGHDQLVIARDAQPLDYRDVEDTILLGPGQRIDIVVTGNAKPGTWLMHCHILDHIEDANAMPDGLITALHYTGTPNTLTAMYAAMMMQKPMPAATPPSVSQKPKVLDLASVFFLAAISGISIFIAFLLARSRAFSREIIIGLNVAGITTLLFLITQITPSISYPFMQDLRAWNVGGGFPFLAAFALLSGLVVGFIGSSLCVSYGNAAEIGARMFTQGAAIGASSASGATLLALMLVVGFTIYNATFRPSTAQTESVPTIALLTLTPILWGSFLGYTLPDPTCTIFFLAIAISTLIHAVGFLIGDTLIIISNRVTEGL
jgi:Multicopper oxidase